MKKLLISLMIIFLLFACTPQEDDPDTDDPIKVEIDFSLKEGQDTVEINTSWEDVGALFTVDGEEQIVYSSDNLNTSQLGLYEINYEATHEGETHRLTRYVIVIDQTPPVITLNPGVDTVKVGETWEDAGATVTDNSGEELTIQVSGTVDVNTVGTYEIVYEATDSSGNTARIIRYVNVVE